jgi:hypothetical protein
VLCTSFCFQPLPEGNPADYNALCDYPMLLFPGLSSQNALLSLCETICEVAESKNAWGCASTPIHFTAWHPIKHRHMFYPCTCCWVVIGVGLVKIFSNSNTSFMM